jgi:hypothetical protein
MPPKKKKANRPAEHVLAGPVRKTTYYRLLQAAAALTAPPPGCALTGEVLALLAHDARKRLGELDAALADPSRYQPIPGAGASVRGLACVNLDDLVDDEAPDALCATQLTGRPDGLSDVDHRAVFVEQNLVYLWVSGDLEEGDASAV